MEMRNVSFEIPKYSELETAMKISADSKYDHHLIKHVRGYVFIAYQNVKKYAKELPYYVLSVHYFDTNGNSTKSRRIEKYVTDLSYFSILDFQIGNFYRFRNRESFIEFVEHCKYDFSCIEDWENYFGFTLQTDNDGEVLQTVAEYAQSNSIKSEPESYPCTCFYLHEEDCDRFGDVTIQMFDFVADNDWIG
jgi:hypothetical protein